MKSLCLPAVVGLFCLVFLVTCAIGLLPCQAAEPGLPNPFFVFDNGLRGVGDPPELLNQLGYAGMGASGFQVAELVKQYRQAGLKVFSTYVGCHLGQTPPFDPQMPKMLEELEGTGVVVWLTVTGGRYGQEDERPRESSAKSPTWPLDATCAWRSIHTPGSTWRPLPTPCVWPGWPIVRIWACRSICATN